MFIRVTKSPTAKFRKVYLVEGYRDENGKSKQRTVKCYGNLEELEKEDPDILKKLREEAKKIPKNTVNIKLNMSETNDDMETDKNYGYFFLESLYQQLGINEFFKTCECDSKRTYLLDDNFRLLVYGRILNPVSKKATVARSDEYFEPFNVSLDSVYNSLTLMEGMKEELQLYLHEKVSQTHGRDISLVFYDVTNYYFETELENDLRKVGMSKEKKRTPIVQMALALDRNGIPVGYKLFSGNTHDSVTMIPTIAEMKARYNFEKIILTADKGLNSGKNLVYLIKKGDGYIVSQKVRGASKHFIEEILNEDGYTYNPSRTFKIKSFIRERRIKDEHGEVTVLTEKVVCFWSADYDAREKHKRQKLEERIEEYLQKPSKYKASNKYGVKKYLKEIEVDTETGEINPKKTVLTFEQEKYERDLALDGYYALVTSEVNMKDEEIIERYRGLWKIEESFRVLKSDLEGRPVYVRREDRIEGHFLVCFVALLLSRLLERMLSYKYSVRKIQETLRNATCRKVDNGIYSLNKQDDVFKDIEKVFGVSLNYKNVRIEQLRSYYRDVVHNIKK